MIYIFEKWRWGTSPRYDSLHVVNEARNLL